MKTLRAVRSFDYTVMTFSGGEQHVVSLVPDHELKNSDGAMIFKRIQKSSDVMDLLLLNETLVRNGAKEVHLTMPYIPYARQDRATTDNSPRSLKVFADLLNSCNFASVRVIDPHSIVAENLINNMVVESVVPYLGSFMALTTDGKASSNKHNCVLVSPDVGAIKKVEGYAKQLGITNIIAFHKDRDPATGDIRGIKQISGTDIDLNDKHIFVVDDICDGGGTFIQLLAAAPQFNVAKSRNLFVTHGIFSKGVTLLLDAGFDNIGCTNSFNTTGTDNLENMPQVKIIKLKNF